jgi:endoglucanase
MLTFTILDQIITRTDTTRPVADSRNYLTATFTVPITWTGTITAVFSKSGLTYTQVLDANKSCLVPWEVLTAGTMWVSAFCGDLKTANRSNVAILVSGYPVNVENATVPTPSGYSQLLALIDTQEDEISALEEDISTLTQDLSTATGDISGLEEDIATLNDDLDTANAEISALQYLLQQLNLYTSAQDMLNNVTVGWNLGNTLENFNTTTPYELDILEKDAYYTYLYIVDSTASLQLIGSSSKRITASTGIAVVSTVITSVSEAEYPRTANRFQYRIMNYAIGDCGTDRIYFTISNFTITKSGGTAQVVTEMNGDFDATISVGGTVAVDVNVDFASYGLNTLQDFESATVSYTLTVTDWLEPANPPSKEDWTETYLQNPVTTKAMLQAVKDKGFNFIRIPTTWFPHWDTETFEASWITRVKQIIDWCVELDLYCILNLHHDGSASGWLNAFTDPTALANAKVQLTTYWTIIATEFKDYSHKLIFEGMNEVLDAFDSWSQPTEAEHASLNQLYQTFVDTVRATGGKNIDRFLSINTYGATPYYTYFVMPTDTVANRLMVQVHYYAPQDFCWYTGSGSGNTAVTAYDPIVHGAVLDVLFANLNTRFVSQGIPVIIGEWASYNKSLNTAERAEHAYEFVSKCKAYGIKCVWWDAGGNGTRLESAITTGALFNRSNLTWWFEDVVDAMVLASQT